MIGGGTGEQHGSSWTDGLLTTAELAARLDSSWPGGRRARRHAIGVRAGLPELEPRVMQVLVVLADAGGQVSSLARRYSGAAGAASMSAMTASIARLGVCERLPRMLPKQALRDLEPSEDRLSPVGGEDGPSFDFRTTISRSRRFHAPQTRGRIGRSHSARRDRHWAAVKSFEQHRFDDLVRQGVRHFQLQPVRC